MTVITIVAEKYRYVIGIDRHARTHTYAIIDTTTGATLEPQAFPVATAGNNRAIAWFQANTTGAILAAVEGTNSYGSSPRRVLLAANIPVVEAKPPSKAAQSVSGKTDGIDATAAARSVLGRDAATLVQPRADGPRVALNVLLAARRRIEQQRTMNRNALNALVRQIDLGLDTRRALTDSQNTAMST